MDFRLDDDQRAFADMAQGLFADFCGDDQLRAHDLSTEPFMQPLWRECVKAGLHGMLIPEADGGLGLGLTELVAVLEQQGRALAQVPLWETQLAAAALAGFAPGAVHAALLAGVLAGDALLTLSLATLSASRGASLHLTRDGDGWTGRCRRCRWAVWPRMHCWPRRPMTAAGAWCCWHCRSMVCNVSRAAASTTSRWRT
jgi:alkylation response protein AidB-like acyl-CoA dehydrogenase